jgi:hypothetical protein
MKFGDLALGNPPPPKEDPCMALCRDFADLFGDRLLELRLQASAQKTGEAKGVASKKFGRKPKRPTEFVEYAANLWRTERHDTREELIQIGEKLDTTRYLPPCEYLQEAWAKQVCEYNRNHSRSNNARPITNWAELAANRKLSTGMRRMFYALKPALTRLSDK